MSYVNEIPTRETVSTLGSSYAYEEIVAAIEEANAIIAEYDATYQAVGKTVDAKLSDTNYVLMSNEDRKLYHAFMGVNGDWYLESINCKGARRGSTEFWPVARIRKDIATMRRQIKNLRKFEKTL